MKTLQSSSRGRGVGSNHRGRGGGRGGGGGDRRFASRFTDPRFQLSGQRRQHGGQRAKAEEAALQDSRFAKHLQSMRGTTETTDVTESEEDELEETSSQVSSVFEEQAGEIDPAEAETLDDEMNAWVPDDELEFIEARRRVAIVNCDWDHVRAVDLYTILFHALPLGGQLQNVSVYMSDYGKKMIEHERIHGPDLWTRKGQEEEDAIDGEITETMESAVEELPEDLSGDEASEPRSDGWQDDDPAMLEEEGEDGEMFSSGKYRKYEMDRMKYYYAVAIFDSPETAAAVYNELDGMDIEASGVVLDLRYIDDDEVFEDPISFADRIPPNFKPLSSFKAAALTQSRFRISWDQDDAFRHHSVQDSFTGTSAEDDLAAYLAPPDSDSDGDKSSGRKAHERLRIRRRYAALLEEIGGIPAEEADEDENEDGKEMQSDDSDDDLLNRFSDVDFDEEEDENGEGEMEMMDEEMEATLDFDADSKATALQRDARLKHKMKDGDLAAKAELKYKLRRKEMKRSKKEMVIQDRAAEVAAKAQQKGEQRQQLKELIGVDDAGALRLSGKERRKQHAKQVKAKLAEERAAKKQMRMANQLGVTGEAQATLTQKEAVAAEEQIDPRFKSKLLSDPRFHLEVAQRDKRISDAVAGLASTVAKARRRAREPDEEKDTRARPDGAAADAQGSGKVDEAVNFFLSKSTVKKRRQT